MPLPEKLLDSIENLEPLPATVQQLLGVIDDDDVSLRDVSQIVEQDEAMVSNVLKMANSIANSGHNRIDNVHMAVVRLGTNTLLEMALGDYLTGTKLPPSIYDLNEMEMWRHSVVCSAAVKQMMAAAPTAGIPRLAPTAALVHDVGKLVMIRYLDANMTDLLQLCDDEQITFVEAEREALGFDHAEVGAEIGRAWCFPEELTDAIRRHHDAELAEVTTLLDAVITANFVSKTVGVGLGAQGMNLKLDPDCLQRLGLSYEDFCRICAETAIQAQQLA